LQQPFRRPSRRRFSLFPALRRLGIHVEHASEYRLREVQTGAPNLSDFVRLIVGRWRGRRGASIDRAPSAPRPAPGRPRRSSGTSRSSSTNAVIDSGSIPRSGTDPRGSSRCCALHPQPEGQSPTPHLSPPGGSLEKVFRFQPVLTLRLLVGFTTGEASSQTQTEVRRAGGVKTELRCHQPPSAASRSRGRRQALVIDYGATGRLRLGCRIRGGRTECRSVTPHGVENCRPGDGAER
jgi:hypothetical protein